MTIPISGPIIQCVGNSSHCQLSCVPTESVLVAPLLLINHLGGFRNEYQVEYLQSLLPPRPPPVTVIQPVISEMLLVCQ